VRISVITVCFNAAGTLADTLRSVAGQDHPDVEHLVIDGGSTDGTHEVVRDNGLRVSRFVSERDRGLYDAMNKGAALATGDVIAFLNADDWYTDTSVLSRVARAFADDVALVYGDLDFVDAEAPFKVRRTWRDAARVPEDFFSRGWHPAHPATFVRSDLFRQVGGFDLRWKISADYAFLARCMLLRPRMRHVPATLVHMRLGGASTRSMAAVWRANRECARALRELGVRLPWATIAMKTLWKVSQKVGASVTPSARRPNEGSTTD
jgi:glycosyltransferase involved in cell wall biosynthesis